MSETGRYIVMFKEHATEEQIESVINDISSNGGSVGNKFTPMMKGFSAEIPLSYLQSNLRGDDLIDYIEPDGVVTTQ